MARMVEMSTSTVKMFSEDAPTEEYWANASSGNVIDAPFYGNVVKTRVSVVFLYDVPYGVREEIVKAAGRTIKVSGLKVVACVDRYNAEFFFVLGNTGDSADELKVNAAKLVHAGYYRDYDYIRALDDTVIMDSMEVQRLTEAIRVLEEYS
jgi:hypothetical protein